MCIDVIVPLEGVVDIDEEVKRINKSVEKIQKDIGMLAGKLSNENYVKNAPEEIVTADKALIAQFKAQMTKLTDSLSRLQ
jgi:valyl-tRNA synthetase